MTVASLSPKLATTVVAWSPSPYCARRTERSGVRNSNLVQSLVGSRGVQGTQQFLRRFQERIQRMHAGGPALIGARVTAAVARRLLLLRCPAAPVQ